MYVQRHRNKSQTACLRSGAACVCGSVQVISSARSNSNRVRGPIGRELECWILAQPHSHSTAVAVTTPTAASARKSRDLRRPGSRAGPVGEWMSVNQLTLSVRTSIGSLNWQERFKASVRVFTVCSSTSVIVSWLLETSSSSSSSSASHRQPQLFNGGHNSLNVMRPAESTDWGRARDRREIIGGQCQAVSVRSGRPSGDLCRPGRAATPARRSEPPALELRLPVRHATDVDVRRRRRRQVGLDARHRVMACRHTPVGLGESPAARRLPTTNTRAIVTESATSGRQRQSQRRRRRRQEATDVPEPFSRGQSQGHGVGVEGGVASQVGWCGSGASKIAAFHDVAW